jgi:hypothetical protein
MGARSPCIGPLRVNVHHQCTQSDVVIALHLVLATATVHLSDFLKPCIASVRSADRMLGATMAVGESNSRLVFVARVVDPVPAL